MKDKLEQYIRDHREDFDTEEPSQDLWKKIIPDHEIKQKPPRPSWQNWTLRIAAVLLIGFISVFTYERFIDQPDQQVASQELQKLELAPEIVELMEAESYYQKELNDKLGQLEQYSTRFASVKEDVMRDLAELDSAYVDLKNELGGDIYKPEVVESMIQNYRIKLEILEDVLSKLKEVEQEEETERHVKI